MQRAGTNVVGSFGTAQSGSPPGGLLRRSPIRRVAVSPRLPGQTLFELLREGFLFQTLADKDELAETRFFLFPEPIPIDREPVVNPMEHRASRIAADPDDSFSPINLASFADGLQLRIKLFNFEWPIELEREGIDVGMISVLQLV